LKKTGPPSAEASCDAIRTAVEESKFVMVHFGEESDAARAAHVGFAQTDDKLRFFHNADAACATEFGGSGIVFFR